VWALEIATGKGPTKLYVYFSKDGENDHACMAFNVGFRFAETEVEVPHEYVVTDNDAVRLKKEAAEM
jgi:hypothetical protein